MTWNRGTLSSMASMSIHWPSSYLKVVITLYARAPVSNKVSIIYHWLERQHHSLFEPTVISDSGGRMAIADCRSGLQLHGCVDGPPVHTQIGTTYKQLPRISCKSISYYRRGINNNNENDLGKLLGLARLWHNENICARIEKLMFKCTVCEGCIIGTL